MRISAALLLVLFLCAAGETTKPSDKPAPLVQKPPAELKLNPFYTKCLDAHGILVISSDKVPDAALQTAAEYVDRMLVNRPDICQAMAKANVRLAVMAKSELTTDIPEHSDLKPKEYWDKRARGLGGSTHNPLTSCAEENLLGYDDDRYIGESIMIHEFAHTIHGVGLAAVDKDFDTRLKALYDKAMKQGLWKDTYAATNHGQYWAEAVQSYFNCNRSANPPDKIHNHVRTREQLKQYDPEIAALVDEVFASNSWTWTPNGAHLKRWND